jgi:hypothetical protein
LIAEGTVPVQPQNVPGQDNDGEISHFCGVSPLRWLNQRGGKPC